MGNSNDCGCGNYRKVPADCESVLLRVQLAPATPMYKDKADRKKFDRRRRNQILQYVADYLKSHPCVDCGNSDIRCLEFDHVRGTKSFCIGVSGQRNFKALNAEIAKCDVRCANCHKLRHYKDRTAGTHGVRDFPMNQGYPDEGADKRVIPGLGPLQNKFILRWAAPTDVEQIAKKDWRLTFQAMPPFVMFEFRLTSDSHWHQIRLGWTWRIYQRYYIPGAAVKTEPGLEPDYNNIPDKS